MKIDDRLSEIFDTEPMSSTKTEIITADGEIISQSEDKIESDYDKSRGNLHDLLLKGQDALNYAIEVAKASEHPRAFEVVGNLIKQLADVNQQLMDIHQQKQKLDTPGKAEASKQVTNNNAIFVGSTSELAKMIKNMNKGD
jgi:predicted house-cleaning noncanonical NTP pyrophosphatase (MazG superfamily)